MPFDVSKFVMDNWITEWIIFINNVNYRPFHTTIESYRPLKT